jgi:DNA-binding transcriptional ArsR family regulator
MSLRATLWAFDDVVTENPYDKLLLLALADEADDTGGSCYPSMRRLAERMSVHVTTVRRHLDDLEAAGLITVDRPEKQGRGHHNRYQLAMPERVAACDPSGPETEIKGSATVAKGSRLSSTNPLLHTRKEYIGDVAVPKCQKCSGPTTIWNGTPNALCRDCYSKRPHVDAQGRATPEPIHIPDFVPDPTPPDPEAAAKLAAIRKPKGTR